ncbi:hypothetical protein RUM43_003191 [Polyplax serrata]|uniref:Uncharacterized protein n=1 Tax=Polyplax serrata TaxID=468196 RepID=A0AAN8NZS2_POLSC
MEMTCDLHDRIIVVLESVRTAMENTVTTSPTGNVTTATAGGATTTSTSAAAAGGTGATTSAASTCSTPSVPLNPNADVFEGQHSAGSQEKKTGQTSLTAGKAEEPEQGTETTDSSPWTSLYLETDGAIYKGSEISNAENRSRDVNEAESEWERQEIPRIKRTKDGKAESRLNEGRK